MRSHAGAWERGFLWFLCRKNLEGKKMIFTKEAEFEEALVHELKNKGWKSEVLKYPSEDDLLKNWANILFDNNRDIDRLNDTPLTTSEMQQIVEQITDLKTPLKLNGFINGKTVSITRDNPADQGHRIKKHLKT
jgi:type I restriction enzyme R subunit